MPIEIMTIDKGATHAPVVFCDQCGYQIEDAEKANAEYLFAHKEKRGIGVVFLHKQCSRGWREMHPDHPLDGTMWMWNDLDEFLSDLVHNVTRKPAP